MQFDLSDITITKEEAENLGVIDGLGLVHKDIYKSINKQILDLINNGEELPWRKPWRDGYRFKGVSYGPQNYVTGNPYRGANAFTMWLYNRLNNEESIYFLSEKQVKERGGKLLPGAKKILVWAFIKGTEVKKDKEGNERTIEHKGIVSYYVYDLKHTEGVKPIKHKTINTDEKHEVIAEAETIIENMPKRPKITNDGGDRAYYAPYSDSVHLPAKNAFHKIQQYYSVAFHELIHSTGHEKRLKRDLTGKFGSKKYAFEELIAEIGAAYLCGITNIEYHTLKNTAAYLKSWAKKLTSEIAEDKTFLFRAILSATKAAKFIIGTTLEKHGEVVTEGEKTNKTNNVSETIKTLYRGGMPLDQSKVKSDGISFTKSLEIAKYWASSKKNGEVFEYNVNSNINILMPSDFPEKIIPKEKPYSHQDKERIVTYAKALKYDGVDLSTYFAEEEVRIFDLSKVKLAVNNSTKTILNPEIENFNIRDYEGKIGALHLKRFQELKNSLQEGILILKSGKKTNGKKMTFEELETVKRSVISTQNKIKELAEKTAEEAKKRGKTLLDWVNYKASFYDSDGAYMLRQNSSKYPEEADYNKAFELSKYLVDSGREKDPKIANEWAQQFVFAYYWDPEFKDLKRMLVNNTEEGVKHAKEWIEFGYELPEDILQYVNRNDKSGKPDFTGDIDYHTAYRAYYNTSWSPDKRAKSTLEDFAKGLESVYDEYMKANDKTLALSYFNEYRKAAAKYYNIWLHSRSNLASSAVVGPAKFPVARMEKLNRYAENHYKKYVEVTEKLLKRHKIELGLTRDPSAHVIKSGSENAIERIKEKIAELEESVKFAKQANKDLRAAAKTDDPRKYLTEKGYKPSFITEILTPDFANRKGVPQFFFTNKNAEIRRLKERLLAEERLNQKRENGNKEFAIKGGRLVENYEANRIQIFFDEMPDYETRSKLKKIGFKWAPSVKAWQNYLSANTKFKLRSLYPDLVEGERKPEIKEPHYPGKEITPNKSVKASVNKAIEDLMSIDKRFREVGAMALSMLYSAYKNNDFPWDTDSLKGKMFEKMEQQGLVEYNKGFEITEEGLEIVEKIEARLQTLKATKAGTDLFPELGNVEVVLQFIRRYIGFDGRTVTLDEIGEYIEELQKAIKAGEIKKTDPYADQIREIQAKLVNAYNDNLKQKAIKVNIKDKLKIEQKLQGLGFIPEMISAAVGAAAQKITHHHITNKKAEKEGLSGVKKVQKFTKKQTLEYIEKLSHKAFADSYAYAFSTDLDKVLYRTEDPQTRKEYNKELADKVYKEKMFRQYLPGLGCIDDPKCGCNEPKATANGFSGVMSANEMGEVTFDSFKFNPYYKGIFGAPATNFDMCIYGDPGTGKTVFLLKLANYFAENFGPVLYVSTEEYGAATLIDKIKRFDINSKNLFFSPKLIDPKVDLKKYKFVFIDSVNHAKVNLEQYKQIREENPNTVFVLILQTTKSGSYRGGKDWPHEVEISMKLFKNEKGQRMLNIDKDRYGDPRQVKI